MNLFQDIKSVVSSPSLFFDQQSHNPKIKKGAVVALFCYAISFLVEAFVALCTKPEIKQMLDMVNGSGSAIIMGMVAFVCLSVITIIFIAIGLGIWSGLIHLSAKIFGGRGEYKSLVTCLLFVQAIGLTILPLSFLDLINESTVENLGVIIGVFCMVVLACFILWSLYLNMLIIKKCYLLSSGKAIGALILPAFALLVLTSSMFIAAAR